MYNLHTSKINYLAKFVPEACYHVYNRTNHKEPLFYDDKDRRFFLNQYSRFVATYVDTYSYCLLLNHFHFAISIKSKAALMEITKQIREEIRTIPQRQLLLQPESDCFCHSVIERQFTRMFTAYATYFNWRYQRKGNLFHRPFKRVAADDANHWQWLTFYIHSNPRKHKIMHDFHHYPWSSYNALISDKPTALCRDKVIELFGDKDAFIAFHEGRNLGEPKNWNLEIES